MRGVVRSFGQYVKLTDGLVDSFEERFQISVIKLTESRISRTITVLFGTMDEPECLLIASETSDPYATVVVNPKTGISCWSYKGNELQGAVTGCVERLGENCFIVAVKDKPLLHVLSMDTSKRFHVKSVLPKPVRYLAVSPDGIMLFAAINNQIYIWIVATGELISVINAHYRTISGLVLNSDGTLLISGAEDGSLCVFIVAELMSTDPISGHPNAFREWRPHSLAVSSISVTRHSNPRILSCSKDHTAALYSVTSNECLLKISCDVALLSCVIDPAECRIFLGTAEGPIAQVDLYAQNKTELSVVIGAEGSGSLPLFSHHCAELVQLDVNHDGSLLASGDASGIYVIWDISSRQCLKTSSLKGSICKLKFDTPWKVMQGNGKKKRTLLVSTLKRQKPEKLPAIVLLQDGISDKNVPSCSDEFCDADLDRVICGHVNEKVQFDSVTEEQHSECVSGGGEDVELLEKGQSSNSENVEFLKAKIAALEKANRQIYELAASLIIDGS